MKKKRKKIKKHGKRFKKKKKKRKRRENDFHEITVEEVVHTRKKEIPLYDQYKALFKPGEQSFWDRWLVKTPPVPVTNGRDQDLFTQVDTLAFIPTDDVLDQNYKVAYKAIKHQEEERAEKKGWGKIRKKMIKDKKKAKEAKLPKIASAATLENAEAKLEGTKKKSISYFGNESESDEEIIIENPASSHIKHRIDRHVHEIIVCEECEVKQCAFTCIQCEQNYCEPCLLKLHSRSKKFASHFWVPFTRVKTSRKNRNDRNQNWMNSLRN